MTAEQYDVLVVGGGMAGASLAVALHGSGLSVAVIEAVPFSSDAQPSYDVRTISLSHGSRLIYQTLGTWQQLPERAVCPINSIHISDLGHAGITHLDHADAGVEALGYVVENRALGQALMAQLEQQDDVSLVCPAQVQDIQVDDQQVMLQCRTEQGQQELLGRLVVIADGGRSGLREKLAIQVQRDDYQQSAIVCNVTPGRFHNHTAYERFTDSGPLALLPMNGNRCWCVWATHSDQVDDVMAMTDEAFLAALQSRFGDRLGRFSKVGKRYSYPLARDRVDSQYRPRVVLVGNAAHTVHPVAAQGFNLGLRDVAWLAEVLSEAAANGDDPGDPGILSRYMQQRERDNQRVSGFTHGMVRLFTERRWPLVVGRNAGLLAVDMLPELKQALLRRTMGLSGRQSRLARGLRVTGR